MRPLSLVGLVLIRLVARLGGIPVSMRAVDGVEWPLTLRRYLGTSMVAYLVWEILQLPLYTLWTTGTLRQQSFSILHCTIGDVMIAGLCILLALALFGRAGWPNAGAAQVYAASLASTKVL